MKQFQENLAKKENKKRIAIIVATLFVLIAIAIGVLCFLVPKTEQEISVVENQEKTIKEEEKEQTETDDVTINETQKPEINSTEVEEPSKSDNKSTTSNNKTTSSNSSNKGSTPSRTQTTPSQPAITPEPEPEVAKGPKPEKYSVIRAYDFPNDFPSDGWPWHHSTYVWTPQTVWWTLDSEGKWIVQDIEWVVTLRSYTNNVDISLAPETINNVKKMMVPPPTLEESQGMVSRDDTTYFNVRYGAIEVYVYMGD